MYIYQADCFCDKCGRAICADLDAQGKRPANVADERTYDLDRYPKRCGDDEDHGASDTPTHCGGGVGCLDAEVLPSGARIGKLLGTDLTTDGERYVREAIATAGASGQPNEVVNLWAERFGQHYAL